MSILFVKKFKFQKDLKYQKNANKLNWIIHNNFAVTIIMIVTTQNLASLTEQNSSMHGNYVVSNK